MQGKTSPWKYHMECSVYARIKTSRVGGCGLWRGIIMYAEKREHFKAEKMIASLLKN
jgi:hypothetical protein